MTKLFDIPLFNLINHSFSRPLLNLAMPFVSRLGGGELYFVLGILLLFSRKKEIKTLGIILLAGLAVSFYITAFLKILIARPRPYVSLTNVILLGPAEKSYSFPSSHAVSAFIIASILSSHFKKYALFYALAAVIAFSRVYMGVHYPSDVIGGAVLGTLTGYLLVRISSTKN